jgi:hypothetical protein
MPLQKIGGRSGAMILRSRSCSSGPDPNSMSNNSYNAQTSAAESREGVRSRHALVLQRGVQYFRVERVSGNRSPQCTHHTLPWR